MGSQLGARQAAAGAQVGNTLFKGGLSAAQAMQQANAYSPVGTALTNTFSNPAFTNALGNYFNQQQYNPVQPGQYTPGSNTFMGPMPQAQATQPMMSWYE